MASTEYAARPLFPSSNLPTASVVVQYDLVCIGFGPAQLATAIANQETETPANILFLERKPAFSWHSASHVPRARMVYPFLYDLATTRNPRSKFTYVNYLLAQNRLVEFANSDQLNPLREEFDDYLRWCAVQFEAQVKYQNEAVSVRPEKENNIVRSWIVAAKDENGRIYVVRTKRLMIPSPSSLREPVVARPLLDVDFSAGQRIISTKDYMSSREALRSAHSTPLDISIIGSTHHTIEILDDILTCPRLGNVTVITDSTSLEPLKVLSVEPAPPPPKLCSIWARPLCHRNTDILDSSELIQHIYASAYEKQVTSKGKYRLRIIGIGTAKPAAPSSVIISENPGLKKSESGLFHGIDSLIVGCRQKGECLEEVQFKRGAVAESCRMWVMSTNSEGGRSLPRDIAARAGEVVSTLIVAEEQGDTGVVLVSARM
ncbi:rhizobactin siderophore biosynthesis protein rhbE [Lindgomyces ingoldianus]|uniref:Rhizobactin siderophore biosynthesis protein rhbE n=1 Tax=Lindgomyces ingoldianus TaxID=673940 RepID=A0ACB6QQI4_9PLEO|nr:rhizobactin siderophore biosynthesis protein rhbE [Lindgomyces ingoldianus]KAF2468426.1 rhizobactin siderophore biosynthesis protein rhbE [Lindgomyces ingoldianus]